jgi:hypothetical protein
VIARAIVLAGCIAGCASTPEALVELGEYECRPMSAEAAAAFPPPRPAGFEARPERDPQACPDGYVPYYQRAPRPPRPTTPQVTGGRYYYAGVSKPVFSTGVKGRILITAPYVVYPGDQVTSEISVTAAGQCEDGTQSGNDAVVETGYRRLYDQPTRFMIGHWVDCNWLDDGGFVRTHPTYAPDMSLQNYVGTGVEFLLEGRNGNWWVWFRNDWVGFFPSALWSNSFTQGDTVHYYGEVLSAANSVPPRTDMGNGLHATATTAAYIDQMTFDDAALVRTPLTAGLPSLTHAPYYSLSYPGSGSMRHGGPGEVCSAGHVLCKGYCIPIGSGCP